MKRFTPAAITRTMIAVLVLLVACPLYAQKSSSSGSRSSGSRSSGSSSSKSSGSHSSSGSSSKPSSSGSSSSKYSGGSTKPSNSGSASGSSNKVGSGTTKPSGSGSSFTAPSSSSGANKPSSSGSSSSGLHYSGSSSKPSGGTAMSAAKKEQESATKYKPTPTATNPPKSSYVSSTGKTVDVRSSATVERLRSRPYSSYSPTAQRAAVDNHVTVHNYNHPTSYYASQPAFHVGGGYSPLFWYMMMDNWSESRRAEWLYHNQSHISEEAYERGMRDATVAAKVAELKAANHPVNPDYVDPEVADDPSIMFEDEFIAAAYNPEVHVEVAAPTPHTSGGTLSGLFWTAGLLLAVAFAVWLVFLWRV